MARVGDLVDRSRAGDEHAADELAALLYEDLRRMARRRMSREPAGHTLTATALVHEAYLRLLKDGDRGWDSRRHFFASAAEAMRRVLIERARRVKAIKRGGSRERVPIEGVTVGFEIDTAELIALHESLGEMEAIDARMAAVVKLRFFAGLSVEETASALDLSVRTVKREWSCARAWLFRRLRGEDDSAPGGGRHVS